MDEFGSGAIQLELKYCERCGGLWLRPQGSELVFCASCARAMAGLACLPTTLRVPRQNRGTNVIQSGFWGEGGNA